MTAFQREQITGVRTRIGWARALAITLAVLVTVAFSFFRPGGGEANGATAVSSTSGVSYGWMPKVDAMGVPLDLTGGGRVVILKTASWCLPCGGEDYLSSVRAQAKANAATTYVVMLVRVTDTSARQEATALSETNVRVVQGELSAGSAEISKEFGSRIPAMAVVNDGHLEGAVAGRSSVAEFVDQH